MNILFVHDGSKQTLSGNGWRGVRYVGAIQRSNLHSASMVGFGAFHQNTLEAQSLCTKADLIVIQGRLAGRCLNAIQRWKARDKVVVIDLEPVDFFYGRDEQKNILPQGEDCPIANIQACWAIRLVDAVTAPSRDLVEEFRKDAPAYWVPEYVEIDRYANLHPVPHDEIILGVFLTAFNPQNIEESSVLSALQCVCQARPQVKVLAWSNADYLIDRNPLRLDEFLPCYPVSDWVWPRPLSLVDIGLASHKVNSEKKVGQRELLEFMVMQIPWLATEIPAYHSLRPYGWLVQDNATVWERMLLDMIDHLDAYKNEASREPYLYGISHGIDENIDNILSIYSSIYKKAIPQEAAPQLGPVTRTALNCSGTPYEV